MKAMDITGVDAHEFAERSYAPDSRLPWDPIESGIARSFLWKEYQRALSGKFTIDCKKQCHVCGLQCPAESGHKALAPALSPDAGAGRPTREGLHIKVRLEFSKTDRARYLSHLETTTALIRAMRRADFPFKYSEGFHPAPRVSFGPALGVGIGGLKEYLDIDLLPPFDPASGLRALQQALPEGLAANRMQIIPQNEKSLNSFIVRYTYEIKGARAFSLDRYPEVKDRTIQRKNGYFLVKDMVEEIKKIDDVTARLTVRDLGETKVRIDELISVLFDQPAEDLSVTRTSMTGLDGIWKEPMEDALWAAKS
jgi:radical SAM-linked protein